LSSTDILKKLPATAANKTLNAAVITIFVLKRIEFDGLVFITWKFFLSAK
jgi:hypothetical protein